MNGPSILRMSRHAPIGAGGRIERSPGMSVNGTSVSSARQRGQHPLRQCRDAEAGHREAAFQDIATGVRAYPWGTSYHERRSAYKKKAAGERRGLRRGTAISEALEPERPPENHGPRSEDRYGRLELLEQCLLPVVGSVNDVSFRAVPHRPDRIGR